MRLKLSVSEAAQKLLSVDHIKDPFLKKCMKDDRKGIMELAKKKMRALEVEMAAKQKFHDMSAHENRLRKQGFIKIAGIDEVGRGPLAGPVVASAVILPEDFFLPGLNDSKQIPKHKLGYYFNHIKREAAAIGIGIIHSDEIDEINIYQAAKKAMNISVSNLSINPDFLLIDAMKLTTPFPQESLIKGDSVSISIAAASIIAKVTRDQMMKEFGQSYPHYRFENNAGYGTPEHLEALRKYGVTPWHRKSFSPVKEYIEANIMDRSKS